MDERAIGGADPSQASSHVRYYLSSLLELRSVKVFDKNGDEANLLAVIKDWRKQRGPT